MRFIPVGLPYEAQDRETLSEKWFPVTVEGRTKSGDVPQTFGQGNKPSPCYYLYRSMVVNADGGISPCCIVYKGSRDFDDLKKHDEIDVAAIWNNEKYRSARSLFSAKELPGRRMTVCDGCDIFAHHPKKRVEVKSDAS